MLEPLIITFNAIVKARGTDFSGRRLIEDDKHQKLRENQRRYRERNKDRLLLEAQSESKKAARRASQKRYREANKERIREYQRRARATGNGKEWAKRYYLTHKEKFQELAATPEFKERHREYASRYSKRNSLKNKDPVAYRTYLDEKTERLRQAAKTSADKRRRLTPEMRRINKAIRTSIDNCLRRQNSIRYESSFWLLGMSPRKFKDYIAAKFQDGMSWDNWGEWELDHIRPSASFDLTKPVQQIKCFHYTNYQPLWKSENKRKAAKWTP